MTNGDSKGSGLPMTLGTQHYSLWVEAVCAETGDVLRRRVVDAGTNLTNARFRAEELLAAAEAEGFYVWQDDAGDGTETLAWHIFSDECDECLSVALEAEALSLN